MEAKTAIGIKHPGSEVTIIVSHPDNRVSEITFKDDAGALLYLVLEDYFVQTGSTDLLGAYVEGKKMEVTSVQNLLRDRE